MAKRKSLTPKMPGQVGSAGNVSPQKVKTDMDKREAARKKREAAKKAAKKAGKKAVSQADMHSAGRKALGSLFARLGVPTAVASLGYSVYRSLKNTKDSQKEYESSARRIAKDSAALKAPPKRGANVMIAGQKVKVSDRALKALKTVEVKERAMDKPAKAQEPKEKKLSFGKAFAEARKAGKKEFTWNGKRYHTRTKEEEDARKKAAAAKGARRNNARRRRVGGTTATTRRN